MLAISHSSPDCNRDFAQQGELSTLHQPYQLGQFVTNNMSSSTKISVTVQDSYCPFVSSGFQSVQENDTPTPIKILWDTGAFQSLLVKRVLPLSDESVTGDHVVIKGVELGFISVVIQVFS